MNDRRTPLAPSEGWLTLGLVLLLCLTMAWAIDDVRLVLGDGALTDFLAPMAVLGVLCAFVGVKVGWGRWLTYLVGALFAALVVPLVVGSMLTKLGTLSAWFDATTASAAKAFNILVVQNLGLTTEYGHYMLVLGLVVWGTSMFAGYATFGHRRPLNAIVIVGLVLLVNMSVTYDDQLIYLVLFSLASLLLLVRYHVLDEQTEWLRRRIGDPASISGIYLRGGSVFIAVAVAASLLLTNVARSAPLEGSWGPLSGTFLDLSRSISKFVPTGGATKAFGSDFDPMSTGIHGKWQPNTAIVATIKLPPDAPKLIYWRAVTYDQFLLNEWRPSEPITKTQIAAGDQLLQGTAENQLLDHTSDLTFTVQPMQDTGRTVLSPATPVLVDKDTDVTFVGGTGNLDAVERSEGGPYTVKAQIRLPGNTQGELNAAALRSAGTDYPDDIAALYLDVPDDAMMPGGPAEQLLQQLVADAPNPDNPFDFATYLQTQFVKPPKDGGIFTYDTDVTDLVVGPCKNMSTVDCFAQYKRGFCQYYATTMAIFLRAQGIPARIAEGYLPGNRVQGQETIRGDSRHQWVEAYFPYYGWVMFDPTGGVSVQQPLPPGPAGASTPPLPSAAFAIPSFRDPRDPEPNDVGRGPKGSGPPIASFIAIAFLLAVIVGGLAFYVWMRGPRGGTTADHAYRTVTRIAARFGFGPRPNQTVYEYAGALGEVLPIARPELEMVAQARVETLYGHFRLEDDRIQALRAAERKLRLNLLRLAFRRRERRRRH